MKFIIVSCCCATIDATAQEQRMQYIMLDMLDSLAKHDTRYQLNPYTLNSKELYGVDETIEMYNFYHGATLILFSVLPDFTSDENWGEVDIADIREHVLGDKQALGRAMDEHNFTKGYGTKRKTHLYSLVKHEDGKYFKSSFCLTEFFYVVHYSSRFNTPYGVLNTGQEPITIKKMKRVFEEGKEFHAPKTMSFPLDVRAIVEGKNTYLDHWWLVQREYLSRELELNGEKAYQFWTFTDWGDYDTYNLRRGVDRFIYLPGKGIVGGSYDFYFLFVDTWTYPPQERKRHAKTSEELWQNVLDEKVMLAEELE